MALPHSQEHFLLTSTFYVNEWKFWCGVPRTGGDRGHLCIPLPKFHCELNFIEFFCQEISSWQLWLHIWHLKGEYAEIVFGEAGKAN